MWLLDHNLPKQLVGSLKFLGIDCDTTAHRGWNDLDNGALVSVASRAEFTCILTRDVLFAESASKAMDRFPQMAIVLITIPQTRGQEYAAQFLKQWRRSPISPEPHGMIRWPS